MSKVQTTVVEIEGVKIAIPVGSMDKPSAEAERIMQVQQNQDNWKLPTTPYYTMDKSIADDLAHCYDWYCGGHEMRVAEVNRYGTIYEVTTKGYYFYVGA
jgi:hypothetical protein